ncbi:hypothetical protein FHG87_007020 [Trinorchestia longiramus]|nr:hypothetical protein FHG87_007020 [Trinorchestia longiramus]
MLENWSCSDFLDMRNHSLDYFSHNGCGGRRMGGGGGTAAGAAQQLFRSPSFSAGRSLGVGGTLDVDDLHSDASMEDDVHDLMSQVICLPVTHL